MTSEERIKRRKQRKRRRKVLRFVKRVLVVVLLLALLAAVVWCAMKWRERNDHSDEYLPVSADTATPVAEIPTEEADTPEPTPVPTPEPSPTPEPTLRPEVRNTLDQANLLAQMYDYNRAVQSVEGIENYENIPECVEAIEEYRTTSRQCIPVDVTTVPHVFYHSLIADPERCFDKSIQPAYRIRNFNTWMITVEEYKKCLQMLYDEGYVVINISDCYVKDEKGRLSPNTEILLPEGKKALIVSYDDLAYYAQYAGMGVADKLILTENGEIKNEYTDADGVLHVGDFDWLPIMDAFVQEHPDFSWHGHKGTIAMTGYDGVFGYRTDVGFFTKPTDDEAKWLKAHPDITLEHIDEYVEQATVLANAIKEDGYEFASHTWGHQDVGKTILDYLASDNRRFETRVKPIIGDTEIIIFAHGTDLGDSYENNAKYNYFREQGYRVFCTVASAHLYWNEYKSQYVRQARIDIDGYQLYKSMTGSGGVLAELGIRAAEVFDPIRPTPITLN